MPVSGRAVQQTMWAARLKWMAGILL